jgi:hypothetical protein
LLGVTTDGSPLYPEPLALIFPGVSHQVCEFHVLKEINKQTLKAVTAVRRELKKKLPKLKRGRPSSQAARKASSMMLKSISVEKLLQVSANVQGKKTRRL